MSSSISVNPSFFCIFFTGLLLDCVGSRPSVPGWFRVLLGRRHSAAYSVFPLEQRRCQLVGTND
jgi:hypothetical protein